MSRWYRLLFVMVGGLLFTSLEQASAVEFAVLTQDGVSRSVICIPHRLWDDAQKNPESHAIRAGFPSPEHQRRRLRESVRDLASVLEQMGGAPIDIHVGALPENDRRVAILIAEPAKERFGPPTIQIEYRQAYRLVVTPGAVGIVGESDLATSYGIYGLLHELGCRWYMPSDLGQVIPKQPTISLPVRDVSEGPYTLFRGLWYADHAYIRRNRLGGMATASQHTLEHIVPKELRAAHPEIRAVIKGEPHPVKVKWTHPLVIDSIVKHHLDKLQKQPHLTSVSISPMDSIGWDEELDPIHDAGDFDPSTQSISKSDRLAFMANQVARRIAAEHPHVLLGMLAYLDYTRPPVREKLHPNIIPQIAPITFSRAHPMTDPGEPNNAVLRDLIRAWGKTAPRVSYYFYAWFLAEASAPNPMMTKWSVDIPLVYREGACRFWDPETLPTFESTMHAVYLGNRLAWNPQEDPKAVIDELHRLFYGEAAEAMARYWHYVDQVWTSTPEYSGCGWGHLRRFTPERLAEMRRLLNAGISAATTTTVRQRVSMADHSLRMFEQFMQMRLDLAEGRLLQLTEQAEDYLRDFIELGNRYEAQSAFGKVSWTKLNNVNAEYFSRFYLATYKQASEIASRHHVLTPMLRTFRYQVDPEGRGETLGWHERHFDDAAWNQTDIAIQTWASLGLSNYMGRVWYRCRVTPLDVEADSRTCLWISGSDGHVGVYINGKPIPFTAQQRLATGYAKPLNFDISAALEPGVENQISIMTQRLELNELGTGGLLGPALIYSARADQNTR